MREYRCYKPWAVLITPTVCYAFPQNLFPRQNPDHCIYFEFGNFHVSKLRKTNFCIKKIVSFLPYKNVFIKIKKKKEGFVHMQSLQVGSANGKNQLKQIEVHYHTKRKTSMEELFASRRSVQGYHVYKSMKCSYRRSVDL